MSRCGLLLVVLTVTLLALAGTLTSARYLPTRADDSRLQDIRDILKEILERTAEGSSSMNSRLYSGPSYEKRFLFKRAAPGAAAVGEGLEGVHGGVADAGASGRELMMQPNVLNLQQ